VTQQNMRLAVLGAGGLGKAAARIIDQKDSLKLVCICDSKGFAYNGQGLDAQAVADLEQAQSVADIPGDGKSSLDPIGDVIKIGSDQIDGILVALPNLPNNFMPDTIKRFIAAGFETAFSDALKRTSAMEQMFELSPRLKETKSTYITGAGASPGLLTAAAVIAAQSYIKVDKVDIWWGVGISNWEQYKATVREDIAQLPGYSVDKAKAMSDEEVEQLLDKLDGKLELHNMEHADDVLLQLAGVVDSRDKVSVGGIIDTRNPKKPVSTIMTLTGKTFDGKSSSHRFILGDETCMAANVIGPALGYLKRARWLKDNGLYGIYGSTQFMPMPVN
jgi:hypothetical protein